MVNTHNRIINDWYIEPEWCVELLLKAEVFNGSIYDPACGIGTIPKVAKTFNYVSYGSDLIDRGYENSKTQDFLTSFEFHDNIICNPPYNLATKFIRKALEVTRNKVAMIVQQQFPYSQGRYDLFTQTPLSKIYFLSNRPSMPPGELLTKGLIEAKGGSVDYLWMVWDKQYSGTTTVHWLKR